MRIVGEIAGLVIGFAIGFLVFHYPPEMVDGKVIMIRDFHMHHWLWGFILSVGITLLLLKYEKLRRIPIFWVILGFSLGAAAEGLAFFDGHSFEFLHSHIS